MADNREADVAETDHLALGESIENHIVDLHRRFQNDACPDAVWDWNPNGLHRYNQAINWSRSHLGRSAAVAKSKKKVETVFLVCEETGDYNYTIRRKSGGEKLKLSKYSPRLRKHTLHVEKKK